MLTGQRHYVNFPFVFCRSSLQLFLIKQNTQNYYPDGGSSGHRDEDVGAEEGRGHCCSAIHDDDDNEDEEGWLDGGERVEELRKGAVS